MRPTDTTVKLTVTTFDGRTAATSQVVRVSTHDVAITKLAVPASANSQGGFDQIGTLTQSISVQTGKSTVTFAFSCTFTVADKAIGKVTFEAIATVLDARDALPADNTAIAPTTVRRPDSRKSDAPFSRPAKRRTGRRRRRNG